jgi:simple sugar transport system permease protein
MLKKKIEATEINEQEVVKEEVEVSNMSEKPKKKFQLPPPIMKFIKRFSVKQWISFGIVVIVYILLAIFTSANMYELIRLTLFSAVPLALVAMGGLYSERSGVVNIALEGIMMFGAFIGILTLERIQGTGVDGQHVLFTALLVGGLAGTAFSLLHAFAAISMKSDQTISGTALNMLSLALAIFLGRALSHGGTEEIKFANTYRVNSIPVLEKIPFFGDVLFNRIYLIALFGLLLFLAMAILAYKTKFGLRLRACGENPQAADAAGINVIRTRYIAVLIRSFKNVKKKHEITKRVRFCTLFYTANKKYLFISYENFKHVIIILYLEMYYDYD